MAFDDKKCPCGGKKDSGVMLCKTCESEFSGSFDMEAFRNEQLETELRRAAAIRLIAKSRRRR